MQTLTLKNTWKNLALVAAGALMATMIAVPLAGNASADDHDTYVAPVEAPTYTIKASNGTTSTFELVERDGKMILVLFEGEKFLTPEYVPTDDGE